jgi:methenyltetrahydromethanopterin cyclohydrolase
VSLLLPVVKITIYRALSSMSVVKNGVFRVSGLMPVVKNGVYRALGFIPIVNILVKLFKINYLTKQSVIFIGFTNYKN